MDNLLRLLTWLSPAFPTGGFAYSSGLEWAVEHGVKDEAAVIEWIKDLLYSGSLWTDVILLRLAHRGEDVAGLGVALGVSVERRLETTAQGGAFVLAAAAWPGVAWGDVAMPYPVAVGRLAAAHGIAEAEVALAFLHGAVANLVSAAVRLIPLGQAAGLRCQAALEEIILEVCSVKVDEHELGGCGWGADIAGMRHETQYTRLFRT